MSAKPPRSGKGAKPKAAKPAPEPAQAPQDQESAPAATGRELAVEGRNEGRNGGTLIRHPPGSNGGVHRDPDRTLRINAMRGLGLQALAKTQFRLVVVEGKKRRVRVEVPMAMCDDIVEGLQLVAREGAAGRHIKEFLAMYFGLHKMMQPGQHEKNVNGHGPRPATFVIAPPTDPPPEPPPARETGPGTLLGPGGQVYVE